MKVKAIVELEAPTTIAQLRKVMGMFAHYAKYIPSLAKSRPLCTSSRERELKTRGILIEE